MRKRDIQARAEEYEDDYEEARDEEFNDQLRDFLCTEENIIDNTILTEDDIRGFLDSFTFPDVSDWCFDRVQSEIDDYEDAKYEQMKYERWENN